MSTTEHSGKEEKEPVKETDALPVENVDEESKEEPSLEAQLEKLRQENEGNYNRYLRSVADLDNYRRRVIREKDELRQYAISGVIEDLLPVIDNLVLGLNSARQEGDVKVLTDGVEMVLSQFKSVLETNGLKQINPGPGDEFDPHQQESLSHQPSEEVEAEKVVQTVRVGYCLNGRLLRPASVVLSKGPSEEIESPAK
ncbi:MAG: nucleotide exchange factor GrpE [Opitutaceae bacterium]|nr:nucleotide exchange factor GrpE [Opitutaceae bacterium]